MAQRIYHLLPQRVIDAIEQALFVKDGTLSEVRLRAGRCASLTFYTKEGSVNIPLHINLTEQEMEQILGLACQGSVYAYEEKLQEGFLPLPHGVRLGMVGQGVCKGGRLSALRRVGSLTFRLPQRVPGCADDVYRLFCRIGKGVLICGPPGSGKTTVLREFIRLASRHFRVCVIDTRGEFSFDVGDGMVDVLEGYPMLQGIEIAVRTMGPQVVVCDEIAATDADALLGIARFGVPLLASVHGNGADSLYSRPSFARILDSGTFGAIWHPGGQTVYLKEKSCCMTE